MHLHLLLVRPILLLPSGNQPERIVMTKAMLLEIAKVDVQTVVAGYRASKVIGNDVLNHESETIGKIDDLLVTRDGNEPYAILSIGGFLGMGTHMVVVRYDSLQFADNKIVLPGGTKDGLKMLPAFEYSKQ